MKKFAVILLVVFFSSISLAHIGHYNKFDKIEMEILRNDEVIGYNNYFFKNKKNSKSKMELRKTF